MKGRLAVAALVSLVLFPGVIAASTIVEQPLFSETEHIVGDVPLVFSGASSRTPSLLSLFSATGTVRTAKIRLGISSWPNANGVQMYLWECPLNAADSLKQCHHIIARDAALGWDGVLIHPPATSTGELIVDFTSAITSDDVPAEYTNGVPLDPTRGYRLEAVFTPNSFVMDVSGAYGTSSAGGFYPYFKLEGDVPSSTPATSTPPVCTQNCNSNVMFLPGIQGSRLYGPDDNETMLWPANDMNARQLQMSLDGTSVRNDIYTRDILDTVGVLRYYQPLTSQLDELKGNDEINDWKPVPYDWRLSLNQIISSGTNTGQNISYIVATDTPYIAQTLKGLAATSRTQKVTVIAHSNGGLVIKALLVAHPELSSYIDKLVLVGVPQIGTPQAIEGILNGSDEAIPFLLEAATIRSLSQNMPMAYNLLPSDSYFSHIDNPVISFDQKTMEDWITRYGTDKVHTVDHFTSFMLDSTHTVLPTFDDTDLMNPIHVNTALFDSARLQHNSLDNWSPNQNIQLVEVAGWGKETLSGIEYKRDMQNVCIAASVNGDCAAFQARPSKLTFKPEHIIEGDGKVVESSAHWSNEASTTRYWLNLQQNGLDHANIFLSSSLLALVRNLVTDSTVPTPLISTVAPVGSAPNRLHFTLHSPLRLGFTDTQGQYFGLDEAGSVTNGPDVIYERFGEVQWLSIPRDLNGQLVLHGTGAGSFTLDVDEVGGNSLLTSTRFEGIPSATSTVVTMKIDSAVSPITNGILLVDFNGDGDNDRILQAQAGEVVLPDITAPEAAITINYATRDLVVTGVDQASTTAITTASSTAISDTSGNTTTMFFKKNFKGNNLTYARITGISYGTTTTALSSSFLYVWDLGKTLISQTVVVDKQFVIEALYDKKKDKTAIVLLKKSVPMQTSVLPGLRVIKLQTNKGGVIYSW